MKSPANTAIKSQDDEGEFEQDPRYSRHANARGGHSQIKESSESVEGLTEGVIMQSTDMRVEYEDRCSEPGDRAKAGWAL